MKDPQYIVILLIAFLGCAGVALPYPILSPMFFNPQYAQFSQFLAIDAEILLSAVLAAYPIGMFLGSSLLGGWSDRIGRKKVLSFSLTAAAGFYLISALAIYYQHYLLFLLARFAIGLCEGNVAIARAIAIDLAPKQHKTQSVAGVNGAIYLGLLCGPVLGGGFSQFGETFVFVAAAGLNIICLLWLLILFKEPHHNKPTNKQKPSGSAFALLRQQDFRRIFAIHFTMNLGMNAVYLFLPLWLVRDKGYTPVDIGYTVACMTGLMVVTSLFFVSRLDKQFGQVTLIRGSALALMVAYLLLPSTSSWLLILTYMSTGFAVAVYNGIFPAYVSNTYQDKGSGALMGLLSSTMSLSTVVISFVGGFSLFINSAMPLYMGVLFIFISWTLGLFYLRAQQHQATAGVQ
jgi:predicted MFS family arabinose efflux permease